MDSLLIKVIQIFAVFFITKFFVIFINRFFNRLINNFKVDEYANKTQINFLSHFRSLLVYLLWSVTTLSIMTILSFGYVAQFIAAFGIFIGFVAREFMIDFVMGFLILIEKQFNIGDKVTIDGLAGIVKEVGIRTVKLELNDGSQYICSNRFLSKLVVQKKEYLEKQTSNKNKDNQTHKGDKKKNITNEDK